MITACYMNGTFKQLEINSSNHDILEKALWVDIVNPSPEEELLVEQCLDLNIPTREEMREIELSSRLYKEDDILFMTATMIAQSDSTTPIQDAVTFLLTPRQLITLRYIEPSAFKLFTSRLTKFRAHTPASFFTEFLDVTVDRLADILEVISHNLDAYSKNIFTTKGSNTVNYHELLQKLGLNAEVNAKTVESLVTFSRLITFFQQSASDVIDATDHARLISFSKDINALSDHANYLSNKVNFLLEATLGMVQIEQNAIIKIFSVAAVIFLPPTLIASIYGMNFSLMPELSWKYGYVLAIALMMFSSWLPYKYFKYRKWL